MKITVQQIALVVFIMSGKGGRWHNKIIRLLVSLYRNCLKVVCSRFEFKLFVASPFHDSNLSDDHQDEKWFNVQVDSVFLLSRQD